MIDEASALLGRDRREVFIALDDAFERIAAVGDERLSRSVT